MKKIKRFFRGFIRFFTQNRDRKLTIQVYFYSMFYRFCILSIPKTRLEKMMGDRGRQSQPEETMTNLKKAYKIGSDVDRVTRHTPWESKCLLRSMTCRKLLEKQGIGSTLKMVAHSWLRCGQVYVTGGDGTGYACVAYFATDGKTKMAEIQ